MRSELVRSDGFGRRSFLLGAGALACSRNADPAAPNPSASGAVARGAPSATALPPDAPARAPWPQGSTPGGKPPPPAGAALLSASEQSFDFPSTPVGKICVVVSLPERREGETLPLLIALHGRGETLKGPERGARGWLDDYALARAAARLRRPPLTSKDFHGFVEPARLAGLNAALAREPHEGVAVACPFLPDIL